jgi:hypothetical protein
MPSTGPAQSWPSGTASRSTGDAPRDHEDHYEAEHDEDIVFRRWAGIVFVAPGFSTRYETRPGASDLVPTTMPPTALDLRSRRANIRANKPVPERRTQLHAVADDPLDNSLDEPECDDAGRSDTGCDGIELPGSQEVRGFESLRLHPKVLVTGVCGCDDSLRAGANVANCSHTAGTGARKEGCLRCSSRTST